MSGVSFNTNLRSCGLALNLAFVGSAVAAGSAIACSIGYILCAATMRNNEESQAEKSTLSNKEWTVILSLVGSTCAALALSINAIKRFKS